MPEPSLPGRLLAPHRPVLALALLACLLYLPSVWLRDLWSPDEPRYAQVAREMVQHGRYALPHLNGEMYAEKPPLYFWLGALAGLIPGVPFESGPRLVSVAAALGTLILTFAMGRRLRDPETGWLAALVLATSGLFVLHASSGVIDATLTFLVTACVAVGLKARQASSPVLWCAFYLLAGLGLIVKGPVAFAVPAGTMLLLALQEDGWRRAWALHAAWGAAVAALVAAAWLIPAVAQGGWDYADTILIKQNLGRAYDAWHHKQPADYFFRVFPPTFLPWVALLPGGIAAALAARRKDLFARTGVTWFLFTFLFFTVISGKKTRYLMPLFPAAAMLAALELRPLLAGSARSAASGTAAAP
ncbi:MAG TPA: glycosyltransferase family 39 protein, partial [Candidatus Polarisedimenticolia bacterium]|nr:glycosyltransferase family 39 protein [Candidatus Polarisedimenticolia bacterium]